MASTEEYRVVWAAQVERLDPDGGWAVLAKGEGPTAGAAAARLVLDLDELRKHARDHADALDDALDVFTAVEVSDG